MERCICYNRSRFEFFGILREYVELKFGRIVGFDLNFSSLSLQYALKQAYQMVYYPINSPDIIFFYAVFPRFLNF